MVSAKGVVQSGMHGPGIYQVCHRHLMNAPQALVVRVCNDFGNEGIVNGYKSINRVVNNFMKGHAAAFNFVKCNKIDTKLMAYVVICPCSNILVKF
jgi:hypothetical protein